MLIPFTVATFVVVILWLAKIGPSDFDVTESLMVIVFLFSSAVYLYFAISVVVQLASYLKIRVFKIPYPNIPPATSTSVVDESDTVLTGTKIGRVT